VWPSLMTPDFLGHSRARPRDEQEAAAGDMASLRKRRRRGDGDRRGHG
jgi:hypothetical protein